MTVGSLIMLSNWETSLSTVLGAGVAANRRLRGGVGLAYFVPLNTFKGRFGVAVRVAGIWAGPEPGSLVAPGAAANGVEFAGREIGLSAGDVFGSEMG